MPTETPVVIDIGGEGRHAGVWNINPSTVRTIGTRRGEPIPRLIQARASRLPLADGSVDLAIVERTPLTREALVELERVLAPHGRVILRHVALERGDRHALARRLIRGQVEQRTTTVGRQRVLETTIDRAGAVTAAARP